MSKFSTRVLLAGLIASLVMGMVEMLYEAIGGSGFWAPVVFIAATIVRGLQSTAVPVPFQPVGVVLGLMGHMMNSVILASIFAAFVAPRLRSTSALVVGAVIYSLAVFVLMWFAVVPLVDPVMLKLNGVVFAISHVMWGAALGLLLAWQQAPAFAPRPAH
jgi:hypothetical protein